MRGLNKILTAKEKQASMTEPPLIATQHCAIRVCERLKITDEFESWESNRTPEAERDVTHRDYLCVSQDIYNGPKYREYIRLARATVECSPRSPSASRTVRGLVRIVVSRCQPSDIDSQWLSQTILNAL